MLKEEAIELLEKEKAYMIGHGGDRQAMALDMAIKALEKETVSRESYDHEYFLRNKFEVKTWKLEKIIEDLKQDTLDDAREDFMFDVYEILDFLPTNNEANQIIDVFDRVTSGLKLSKDSALDKIREKIEALPKTYPFINHFDTYVKEDDVRRIIDKYRGEMENME